MEVLSRIKDQVFEPITNISDHRPREFVRSFPLPFPYAVHRDRLSLKAAMLVLLAAAAGARIVPADLRVRWGRQNAARLRREVRKDKGHKNAPGTRGSSYSVDFPAKGDPLCSTAGGAPSALGVSAGENMT